MNNQAEHRKIIGNNISFLMFTYGKTRNDLCKDLDIKYTTLTDWIKGNTAPNIEYLEKLAGYFNLELGEFLIDIPNNSKLLSRVLTYAEKIGVTQMDTKLEIEKAKEEFTHKTFKERIDEYDGQISVYDFDWGKPKGDEML